MFLAQPVLKDAAILTQLPERFRIDKPTAWADANRGGEPIDSFLEGPVFDGRGNLYVTDIPHGRIFRISPQLDWELIVEYDGEPNGMKFLTDDAILIADYKNGLVMLRLDTREIVPCLQRHNSERFKGVNDLILDTRGNVYFTDQGQTGLHDSSGRVYRLCPAGRLDLLLHNVPSPNGIVLSADEKVLYVAATRGNAVWRVPLMPDGNVAKAGLFFSSSGPSGPDGLAMDEDGNLLVANPGLGLLWVLSPRAEPLAIWRSPAGTSLTNLAFGGPDRKTIYCTESVSGSILQLPALAPGRVLPSLMGLASLPTWIPGT
jgi:gluconolactonase